MTDKNSNRGNAGWGEVKKGYATDAGVVPPVSSGSGSSTSSSQSGSTGTSGSGSSTPASKSK